MAKILIVDDERVLVKGIKFNLEHEGYQVQDAYDGEEAVELAREGGFDLIILDVMMPKIDGLQACMRIREFSNVPIIMLTACPAAAKRQRAGRRPHYPQHGGADGQPGRGLRGADRQGVRPDGAADAQPWPGVQPGEPAERGLGI